MKTPSASVVGSTSGWGTATGMPCSSRTTRSRSGAPALSVSTILISLQSLLGEPNNRSPLNVEAAELWDKPDQYKAELAKHYRPLE